VGRLGQITIYCTAAEEASSSQLQATEIQISNEDCISNEGHIVKLAFYSKSAENMEFWKTVFL